MPVGYSREMRKVVVTFPNLSAARAGEVVTAAELGMSSEDKLDDFIAAGYGTEIFGDDDDQPDDEDDDDQLDALVGDVTVSNDMTKDELLVLAAERDVAGRSSMTKDELITALQD